MQYCVFALSVCLLRAAVGSEAHVLATEEIPLHAQVLTGQPLINYLKQNQKLFEVEMTPKSEQYMHSLMDENFIDRNDYPPVLEMGDKGDDIPESFDARKVWSNCSSLFHIRDQSNCGSCWAVSSAAAMSDRVCIASKGAVQVLISDEDILTCCPNCGYGCDGGWPIRAWQYFAKSGVVSGGDYDDKDCCRPYDVHPCGRHGNETYYGECNSMAETPACMRQCQAEYNKTYEEDKLYGKSAYKLPRSEKEIQRDIMKNGPVVAAFIVYQDFMYYKKGIYKHTAGRRSGGHAVKIIGWGKEGDVPYWIIANSWHSDWGEDGYFRMVRGINHCGIEQMVAAGLVR